MCVILRNSKRYFLKHIKKKISYSFFMRNTKMNELYGKIQANKNLLHELKISNTEIIDFLLNELNAKNIIIANHKCPYFPQNSEIKKKDVLLIKIKSNL